MGVLERRLSTQLISLLLAATLPAHAIAPTAPAAADPHAGHQPAPPPASTPASPKTEDEHCPHCGDGAPKKPAGDHDHAAHCDHKAHGKSEGEHCAHCDGHKAEHKGHHGGHGGHGEHGAHGGHSAAAGHSGHTMTSGGVLGPYAMAREASGTSWQPDATPHHMGHDMAGDWMISAHAMLNLAHSWQDGPRGDDKTFVAGMLMASARRNFQNGDVLNFRAMLSPDPLMGKSGYPLLLASGETADGVSHLVDRQHPHDFFVELSASYSLALAKDESLFLYAGLPGEPAFGPPTFMHRQSAMNSPEAPISHHWLDSTHITFGVLTAGWVKDAWKLEVSAFKGREPDQDRFDIESPKLDSVAARVSWNPTPNWSLQLSWADQESVEQLEPEVDVKKLSASAIYTVALDNGGWWSTTAAWGWKDPSEGDTTNAFVLEAAYAPDRDWTVFARGEVTENPELSPVDEVETVGKLSFGAVRDFHVAENTRLGVGALYSVNFVPGDLEPSYGGDPDGAMVFIRLTTSN